MTRSVQATVAALRAEMDQDPAFAATVARVSAQGIASSIIGLLGDTLAAPVHSATLQAALSYALAFHRHGEDAAAIAAHVSKAMAQWAEDHPAVLPFDDMEAVRKTGADHAAAIITAGKAAGIDDIALRLVVAIMSRSRDLLITEAEGEMINAFLVTLSSPQA